MERSQKISKHRPNWFFQICDICVGKIIFQIIYLVTNYSPKHEKIKFHTLSKICTICRTI